MLDCVQDGNFLIDDHIGIIGHSLWYRILPFKQVRLVIIDSDLKLLLRYYVHNSSCKGIISQKSKYHIYNYRFRHVLSDWGIIFKNH